MYFDQHSIVPRFEFGFGLSYQFTTVYSGLTIASAGTNSYTVTATIKNTGALAGTEIAQLYLGFPTSAGEPPKVLKGFEAVPLGSQQSQAVSFTLVAKDISCVYYSNSSHIHLSKQFHRITSRVWSSTSQAFVRPSGTFTVYVGASSRAIRLTGSF